MSMIADIVITVVDFCKLHNLSEHDARFLLTELREDLCWEEEDEETYVDTVVGFTWATKK